MAGDTDFFIFLTREGEAAIRRLPLLTPWVGCITRKEIFMRKFETLILLSPELASDSRDQVVNTLKEVIEREGGNVEEVDSWGMRDLAYPVRKQMRGFYVRLVYTGPNALVAELERNIRIAYESIYKFLTVRLEDEVAEAAKDGEVA